MPSNSINWKYFDRVICITVDTSSERVKNIRKNLYQVGLLHFEFFVFPRSVVTSNIGMDPSSTTLLNIMQYRHPKCIGPVAMDLFHHHINAVQYAFDSACETVLILEDDNHFDVDLTKQCLPKIISWLEGNDEWLIINFGAICFPLPFTRYVHEHVAVAQTAKTGNCYALSRRGMELMLEACRDEDVNLIHIDQFMADIMPKYHVARPQLAFQTEAPALFRLAAQKIPQPLKWWMQNLPFERLCKSYTNFTFLLQCVIACFFLVVATRVSYKSITKSVNKIKRSNSHYFGHK